MKITDRLSRLLGRDAETKADHQKRGNLDPSEIRRILEGRLERLYGFASSPRIHATDPKGDTPLHLAARSGNLPLCDLFVRSGADPAALNFERQTPADLALGEGHTLVAQLLSSLLNSLVAPAIDAEREALSDAEGFGDEADVVQAHPHSEVVQSRTNTAAVPENLNAETSWTAERIEILKKMWAEGCSASEIARELGGVSRNAVIGKAHRLGLWEKKRVGAEVSEGQSRKVESSVAPALIEATTTWTAERIAILKQMWAAGCSASEIAQELGGVSRNAVIGRAFRLGLRARTHVQTDRSKGQSKEIEQVAPAPNEVTEHGLITSPAEPLLPENELTELDGLLDFDAEPEPIEFFNRSSDETAVGTFVPIISSAPAASDDEDKDWELDLSPVQIAGEGIGSATRTTADHSTDHDYLKVGNRGRQSVKRAVVQTGTRLSIDPKICTTWAEETLTNGWCSPDDIDNLVALCEGNGDYFELRINIQRILEAADIEIIDKSSCHDLGDWDARSEISPDDLAEAIEAALSRSTPLPGTQLFVMDRHEELQLLEPMIRAKQELQLAILASEAAVEAILDAFESISEGTLGPGLVSLRSIIPSRLDHSETAEVFSAVETLKLWQANGRAMDGKRRREALAALETLDLSPSFRKVIVEVLKGLDGTLEDARDLEMLISTSEAVTERLIVKHLPYVRRFAARNVEPGEDLEDVFQVAFTGLQRSTRRFDPARGYRFLIYATYWMRQSLSRWRADESSEIRIPAHRHESLSKLDRVMEKLDVRYDGFISDHEIAAILDWNVDDVKNFRQIPRYVEHPKNESDWDQWLPEVQSTESLDHSGLRNEISRILMSLTPREERIIRLRFGIGIPYECTLEEIGETFSLTRERIRQIESKALRKLKHPMRSNKLRAWVD